MGIPLKDNETASGDGLTAQQFHEALGALSRYLLLDFDITKSYKNRLLAVQSAQELAGFLRVSVENIKSPGLIQRLFDSILSAKHTSGISSAGRKMITKLLQSGKSVEAIIWQDLIPIQGAGSTDQSGAVCIHMPIPSF